METYDLAIIGGGPAGLATASHAHANGMKYVLLERTDHLADTVYNYQARKFVMAEPVMIPARGELPVGGGSREQILEAWQRTASEPRGPGSGRGASEFPPRHRPSTCCRPA